MLKYNPDNLTPEQIGPGYRLLTLEEVKLNDLKHEFRPGIDCWLKNYGWAAGCVGNRWKDGAYTYRVLDNLKYF